MDMKKVQNELDRQVKSTFGDVEYEVSRQTFPMDEKGNFILNIRVTPKTEDAQGKIFSIFCKSTVGLPKASGRSKHLPEAFEIASIASRISAHRCMEHQKPTGLQSCNDGTWLGAERVDNHHPQFSMFRYYCPIHCAGGNHTRRALTSLTCIRDFVHPPPYHSNAYPLARVPPDGPATQGNSCIGMPCLDRSAHKELGPVGASRRILVIAHTDGCEISVEDISPVAGAIHPAFHYLFGPRQCFPPRAGIPLPVRTARC